MDYKYDKEYIFAKILRKEIPSEIVYETNHSLAFRDINPAAPVHILIIPKGPYVNFDHFIQDGPADEILDFNKTVAQVISKEKLNPNSPVGKGYRIITNTGLNGVQEVPHLHFHVLGGRNMGQMVIR